MYTSRKEFLESNHPLLDCKKTIISIAHNRVMMRIDLDGTIYACSVYNKGNFILDSSSTLREQCDFDEFNLSELYCDKIICKWGF